MYKNCPNELHKLGTDKVKYFFLSAEETCLGYMLSESRAYSQSDYYPKLTDLPTK